MSATEVLWLGITAAPAVAYVLALRWYLRHARHLLNDAQPDDTEENHR